MQLKFGSSTSSGGGRSAGGKGCLSIFFLVFLLMGAVFTVALAAEAIRVAAVWLWPEHPCTVLSATVTETGDDSSPYEPSVLFEYEIDGRVYRSDRVARGSSSTSSYDTARRPADRFPPGSAATCRVHPDRPGEAVLERRIPWIGFAVLLPLIFVAVGAGGLYFVWKGGSSTDGDEDHASISERAAAKGAGWKIGLGVGLVFVAVGGGLSVFLLVMPVARVLMALDWVETPAVVVSSTIRSWSSDDGMSYRTDILYEYSADGRTWRSNRLRFFPGGSGDYDDHRAMTARFPAGEATLCYVDPDDPTRSVLIRKPSLVFLIGLFPLVFLLAGLGATSYSLKARRRATIPDEPSPHSVERAPAPEPTGSVTLEPEASPMTKVVGMTFIAAFWNGITGVFVWLAVKSFLEGDPEWFLTVFITPFVLIGLALIAGIFYFILALANPRPTITITPPAPRLGTRLHIEWSFTGRAQRMQRLLIVVEGVEKATYRRGTNTHTDTEVFVSIPVVDTTAEWEIARGSARAEIPEDTMHSFSADNNAIVWSIHLHGDIARWPDVLESFEIDVRPLSRERLLP